MNDAASNELIAKNWFDAFNRHHLEDLLALYDDNAIHLSLKLKLVPKLSGALVKSLVNLISLVIKPILE